MEASLVPWRPARLRRRVTAVVAAFTLTAAPLTAVSLSELPAEAAFATGGVGQYQDSIDWFEWGTVANTLIPTAGMTKTNTRAVPGGTLETTCTIGTVSGGSIRVYRPGSYSGDTLDDMYNIGGTGASNQMLIGLAGAAGSTSNFSFTCSATLNGGVVPLAGLVMADAEASGSTEYVQATIPAGGDWRIIDRYRSAGCTQSTPAVRTGQTLRLAGTALGACSTYPGAVAFMEGVTSASVSMKGGGVSAIALGVMLFTDFGDAPASYGDAGALYSPTFVGGEVAAGTTQSVFDPGFALATPGLSDTRLGADTTPETASQPGPTASLDGADDATTVSDVLVAPGGDYTLPAVECTGPGFVAGWMDWNNNGTFDAGERSNAAECVSSSVDLDWTVPADAVRGDTFLRLRIAATEADVASPVGVTSAGEVEDYEVAVDFPLLTMEKTSTATADTRVGDVVTYTVTATNNTDVDFTTQYPATVLDDLTGVLDDATYANDAVASMPGTPSYLAPLLSWEGVLLQGESVEITYTATVKADGDGEVRNVAWQPYDPQVTTTPSCDPVVDGVDETTGEPCATAIFELPKLEISKSADTTEIPAFGEDVEYTVTVTNSGPGDYTAAAPASMVDDLTNVLTGATYNNDAAATAGTVDYSSPELSWSGPLASGESADITYTVTYTGEDSYTLLNAACVPESELAQGAVACDSVQIPGAGLTQSKGVVASESPVATGTVLTYTLVFENEGDAAAAVDAVDDLTHVTDDADVTTEPSSVDGLTVSRSGNQISIGGSVPAGESFTVTYAVTVKADGDRGDGLAANFLLAPDEDVPTDPVCEPVDSEHPDCTVTPIGLLVTSKSVVASDTPVVTGSTLTYTLTFDNQGQAGVDVDHTDVLTDVLDDATLSGAAVSSDEAALTVDASADSLLVTGSVAAGETVTVTYVVTVNAESDRGNNSADNFLIPTGEDVPEDCVDGNCTTTPLSNVAAVKSVSPESGSTVLPGDVMTYTLTFTNGGQAAGAVDYTDYLAGVLDDATLTDVPVSSDSVLVATVDDDVLEVVGTLVAGQSVTVTYSVTVKADGARGDNSLGNFLVPAGGDVPEECVEGSVLCTTNPVPEIVSSKSVDPVSTTPVVAGQELVYTLTFENVGQAAGTVDAIDDLTHVTDDADVIVEPESSDSTLTVIRDGNAITIDGVIDSGESVTVSYTVKVKGTEDRGDAILANFLLNPGEDTPDVPVCESVAGELADCTVNPVGEIKPTKSVNSESGMAVESGTILTYTLSFENTGKGDAAVDFVDTMSDVLDDAAWGGNIEMTDGLSVVGPVDDSLMVSGTVAPGETSTVTYQVRVLDYKEQGNHKLENFLTIAGGVPPAECVDGNPLCTLTSTQEPPPVTPALAFTGGAVSLSALLIALLALSAGAGLMLTSRRRNSRVDAA